MRLLCFLLLLTMAAPVRGQSILENQPTVFPGPYEGRVLRVIDGDTIEILVFLWPGLSGIYDVRVKGVDVPESRTSCEHEKELGLAATEYVSRRYGPGQKVELRDVEFGSFARRVLADIRREYPDRMLSLRTELLRDGKGVAWEPGEPARNWCAAD